MVDQAPHANTFDLPVNIEPSHDPVADTFVGSVEGGSARDSLVHKVGQTVVGAYASTKNFLEYQTTAFRHDPVDAMARAARCTGRIGRSAFIAAEVLPTNGILTYGFSAAVLLATKNVAASAAVLGLSTTLLEGAAGEITARRIASGEKEWALDVLQKGLELKRVKQYIISEDNDLKREAEILLNLYAGVPTAMVAKMKVATDRTYSLHELQKYSRKAALALGGVCLAQGVLYGEGIMNFSEPKVMAPLLAFMLGIQAVKRNIKKRLLKNEENVWQ